MKSWVIRHPLSSFFFVAYAMSWSIAVPLALQAQGVLPERLPWSLHYLTAFGPAVAAFLIARLLREPAEGAERPQSPSVAGSSLWWTVGFGSPLLLLLIAQGAARIVGQTGPTWTSLGNVNFLPHLGLMAWALWFLTSGCGEELGWRGFALPRLQRTHSAMASSALLAIGWAGWHLPAFFYIPSYAAMGLRVLPGFFFGLLAGAIVLTWLYNSSGGSVLAAVLWHASFNFVTSSPSAGGFVAAATSTLVMVWAIAVVWRLDWTTLSAPAAVRSVRATREEKTRVLPGDERILRAIDTLTHGALAVAGTTLSHLLVRSDSDITIERARGARAGQSWDRRLLGGYFIISIATFLIAGLDSGRFGWSGKVPLGVTIAGVVLMLLGQVLFAVAKRQNAFFSGTVRIQTERGHQVCDSGLYRFVRHPGYLGILMSLLAFPLVMNSYWAFVPVFFGVVVLVARTVLEDCFLMRELSGYPDYADRTRWRLVPRVF